MYFCLPNINNPMYIQLLGEMVPSLNKNNVEVCNQITLVIPYYISSRLVTLLKITGVPIQVSEIFFLLLVSRSSILAVTYFFFLSQKCILASHLTLFQLSTLHWYGSCNHCILACVLWSKDVNIFNQTMVYAASIHTDQDYL